jgi:hypothetical protein
MKLRENEIGGAMGRIGKMRSGYTVLLESLNGRDFLDDLSVHEYIVFKFFLRKQGRYVWTGFIWLRL